MRQTDPGSLGDLVNAAKGADAGYYMARNSLMDRRADLVKHAKAHPEDAPIVTAVLAVISDPLPAKEAS